MWRFLCLAVILHSTRSDPKISQVRRQQNDRSLDIRLAVPGEPGSDYPTLGNIPRTSFSCSGKEPGYYADVETNCQAFRVCTRGTTFGFQSFLCPNGTLFNQAVFVCDWWMNVNCEKSRELLNKNTEKFANLQLGPQLMKDIKKMITFPMLNNYDKNAMKSKLIVMQNYFPPKGQMTISGGFANDFNTNSNNDFYQQKRNIVQSGYVNNDISFAASTPSSQYIPASINGQPSPRNDAEVFQRQSQAAQYQGQTQNLNAQNTYNTRSDIISKGRSGKLVQSNSNMALPLSAPKSLQQNIQFRQSNNAQYVPPYQQGINSYQIARQLSNPQQSNFIASKEFDSGFQAQYAPYPKFSPEVFSSEVGNEAKQNLVSNNVAHSPIIAKSLTLNKVVRPKPGAPLSRITFKTWLVKPSRAKLIGQADRSGPYSYEPSPSDSFEPIKLKSTPFTNIQTTPLTNAKSAKISIDPNANTPVTFDAQPYKYEKPSMPPSENIVKSTPFLYNKPTAVPQQVTQAEPYVYNKPMATPQRVTQAGPYVYNKPTTAPQRVTETGPYFYDKPKLSPRQIAVKLTSPKPTLIGPLYLPPSSVAPTQPTRLYVPPITTYKPAAKLYLPPSSSSQPIVISNQYLPPQNEKLQASPSTPTPFFAQPDNSNTDSPSFSLTKHSRINANHNNLTFADILTKEKLDITVNDIVKTTNKILTEANPQKSSQYRLDENYLPPESEESGEVLTPASPTNPKQSAKIVQSPSIVLEPPLENSDQSNNNLNSIAKLPFYVNPTNPTIERTVSLKISIPEKIASRLFNINGSKLDSLEILNTGSTNYLVLANNQIKNTSPTTFIPIAKLVEDKQANYSDSQALVYKILQDSLNVAKEYNNIAQQSVLTTKDPIQNVNEEDYTQITNKISQLTAQQYSENNDNYQNTVKALPAQIRAQGQVNEFQQEFDVVPSQQTAQQKSLSAQLNNQIYSGQLYQLPVPEVTNHINNPQNQQIDVDTGPDSEVEHLQSFQNGNNHDSKTEIVQSQAVPLPAKLQQEEQSINEQDINTNALIQSLLNSGNGISAQVQDKIVGTIPHPSLHNKLVTYQNDKSYFVVTHNNFLQQTNTPVNSRNANLVQNNSPEVVTYQLLPSVSYQLNDEKDQENILNTFQINQYGQPKNFSKSQRLTQDVNLEVEHPAPLYSGPSSYSAPQASVGRLESKQKNNHVSRIEQFENPNNNDNVGYA